MEISGSRIAIVGAAGLVGRTALSILLDQGCSIESILLLSTRDRSSKVSFGGLACTLHPFAKADLSGVDGILLCTDEEFSRQYARELSRISIVVDCSSAFRLDEDVPLCLAPRDVEGLRSMDAPRLIANPDCSAAIACMALAPIARKWPPRRISLCSYQSASGGGQQLLAELDREPFELPSGSDHSRPAGLHRNIIPEIGEALAGGDSSEEMQLTYEIFRLLGQKPAISMTAVRVPTEIGHGLAIHMWTDDGYDLEEIRRILQESPGIDCWDEREGRAPTILDARGEDAVLVGRLRRPEGDPQALCLWVVGDNLRRGAALNAVELLQARLAAEERS